MEMITSKFVGAGNWVSTLGDRKWVSGTTWCKTQVIAAIGEPFADEPGVQMWSCWIIRARTTRVYLDPNDALRGAQGAHHHLVGRPSAAIVRIQTNVGCCDRRTRL